MFINNEVENVETDTIRDHLVKYGHSVKVGREGNEGENLNTSFMKYLPLVWWHTLALSNTVSYRK